ncbi:Major Facilitator Superfamily protein [Streptomyces wuyuanensis]|uniref:Major Facilitator Superfamily protein n=1 Tax=Streptomyces wuyuanensis TaxID=1196353 RepID=A0A1H0EDS0_9ACTN|nr:Major Facilitator Superfamily protein [Streptomyces wuyuanensis]
MSQDVRQPVPRRWLALLFIATAQLMVFLDGAIMNIALPSAQQDLHFTDGGRQWVITAYGLAFGGLLILGGRLGDLWGRKRVFVIGLVGFALASGIGGAARNLPTLLTARALQGVFGALLAPAALALISLAFTDARERAKAFGIYGAIATAGGALGLLLGGIFTEYTEWRWGLYINLPIEVIGIFGVLTVVRDPGTPAGRARLDVPGALLASGGAVCVRLRQGGERRLGCCRDRQHVRSVRSPAGGLRPV